MNLNEILQQIEARNLSALGFSGASWAEFRRSVYNDYTQQKLEASAIARIAMKVNPCLIDNRTGGLKPNVILKAKEEGIATLTHFDTHTSHTFHL